MLKFSSSVIWRLGSRGTLRKYSTSASVLTSDKTEALKSVGDKTVKSEAAKENSGLVAAAFASLNTPDAERKPSSKSVKYSKQQQVDLQIQKADTIDSLLTVAENPVISRRHALKMVSMLSEWSNSNKVKLDDFEKDPRFLKLCRILARSTNTQALTSITMAEDLSTVLGITGDDEAARLITNLTLPQMIKVMKALQLKGRRSTPLLRALAHNITRHPEPIDLKKSADLLFSMAALNFPDPVLLDRICSDVIECLPHNEDRPAVVNSILVSLGMLRWRHEGALRALAAWGRAGRPGGSPGGPGGSPGGPGGRGADALVTLAMLDYQPDNFEELVQEALALKEEEMSRAGWWLELVFALLVLRRATPRHLASTLQPDFIDQLLSAGEIPIPARRKLMAIDAYLRLSCPSETARLAEDISVGVPVVYTKEKTLYVQSIMDTFKSLVSSEKFFKKDINSGMGFLYDAEFAVDDKCHPVSLENAENNKNVHRIAVLGLDYHDMTRKTVVPLGHNSLYATLLQMKGFKVLVIPYTEYNPKDKLVNRVQYIEKKLKAIVSGNTSA